MNQTPARCTRCGSPVSSAACPSCGTPTGLVAPYRPDAPSPEAPPRYPNVNAPSQPAGGGVPANGGSANDAWATAEQPVTYRFGYVVAQRGSVLGTCALDLVTYLGPGLVLLLAGIAYVVFKNPLYMVLLPGLLAYVFGAVLYVLHLGAGQPLHARRRGLVVMGFDTAARPGFGRAYVNLLFVSLLGIFNFVSRDQYGRVVCERIAGVVWIDTQGGGNPLAPGSLPRSAHAVPGGRPQGPGGGTSRGPETTLEPGQQAAWAGSGATSSWAPASSVGGGAAPHAGEASEPHWDSWSEWVLDDREDPAAASANTASPVLSGRSALPGSQSDAGGLVNAANDVDASVLEDPAVAADAAVAAAPLAPPEPPGLGAISHYGEAPAAPGDGAGHTLAAAQPAPPTPAFAAHMTPNANDFAPRVDSDAWDAVLGNDPDHDATARSFPGAIESLAEPPAPPALPALPAPTAPPAASAATAPAVPVLPVTPVATQVPAPVASEPARAGEPVAAQVPAPVASEPARAAESVPEPRTLHAINSGGDSMLLSTTVPQSGSPVLDDADEAFAATEVSVARRRKRGAELVTSNDQREFIYGHVVVGRNPSAPPEVPGASPLRLRDQSRTLSKTHAHLEVNEHGVFVTDLGSSNGTTVVDAAGTETELDPLQPVALQPGAHLLFGDLRCEVLRP